MSGITQNHVAQTLTVSPEIPASPMMLCDSKFLHTLGVVEREVAHLSLATPQDAQNAANLLQRLTSAGTALEKARTELKRPFRAACEMIDAAAKIPGLRIEQAKDAVKAKVTAFDQEQKRLAAEAQRAREAELARLEAVRKEEERMARVKADELAKAAAEAMAKQTTPPVGEDDFDDGAPPPSPPKTETELAIERVKFAPAPVMAKPQGVSYRVTLVIDKLDPAKLPDAFVTRVPKEAAIRSTFLVGWREGDPMPECPGATFKVDRQVVSTGRAVF